jgi:DNA invertase Pin-like site-specific DNA recombinase
MDYQSLLAGEEDAIIVACTMDRRTPHERLIVTMLAGLPEFERHLIARE